MGKMLLSPQHARFGDQQEMLLIISTKTVDHTCLKDLLYHLGKFEGKADEGFLVGYSVNRSGPEWLFDIDSLTKSINYEPVTARNQTNDDAGIEINGNAGQAGQEKASDHEYILLPFMPFNSPLSLSTQSLDDKDAGVVPSKGDEGVWTLVDLPNGKRAIGTKWVFRNKKDERGIADRNKPRLVAQGYTQEEGTDYDEVFIPVARIEAIRSKQVDLKFAHSSIEPHLHDIHVDRDKYEIDL
nr:copia protein [Tanacetum cinerariifolium]